jgi:tripartite-type tricarboxylate transporter receptor subunit TctC
MAGLSLTWAVLLAASAVGEALAQSYPSKPVHVIVPLAAGGVGDVFARAVGQRLSESFAQPVVIDNRPGANNIVGTEAVARAAPDGHTLLLAGTTITINPSLYPKLTYDPIRDFAPISLVATTPLILVVHPSLPVKSAKDLIAMARTKPGQIFYGSAGNGSTLHLAGEMLNTLAGVKLVHVPYKGVTYALNDLLGGQVSVMFPGAPIALPQAKSGRLRALATSGASRTGAAPELPTLAESGVPGYEGSVWYGLLAPAGTPAAIVNRLNADIVRIVQSQDIRDRWAVLGADPAHNTPAEFAAYMKDSLARWSQVVRASGAKLD